MWYEYAFAAAGIPIWKQGQVVVDMAGRGGKCEVFVARSQSLVVARVENMVNHRIANIAKGESRVK